MLSLEALKNMFHLAVENLRKARSHRDPSFPKHLPHHFEVGDTMLIKIIPQWLLVKSTLVIFELCPLRVIKLN